MDMLRGVYDITSKSMSAYHGGIYMSRNRQNWANVPSTVFKEIPDAGEG